MDGPADPSTPKRGLCATSILVASAGGKLEVLVQISAPLKRIGGCYTEFCGSQRIVLEQEDHSTQSPSSLRVLAPPF